MRTNAYFLRDAALLLGAILLVPPLALGGNLTPNPGPVMPTMKTMTEVEPRIPVQDLPSNGTALYVIDQPGSYYLTNDIFGESGKHGIELRSTEVTLDFNGFSLIGVPGSLDGITTPVGVIATGTTVKNGTVSNWGNRGLYIVGASVVHGVLAHNNGNDGINTNTLSVVTNCVARENGGIGFFGSHNNILVNCISSKNSVGYAHNSTSIIRSCIAHNNTGNGIVLLKGGTISGVGSVIDCTSNNNGGVGISVETGGLISTCSAIENSGGGIDAPDSLVRGNIALGNTGFNIQGNGATLDGNHAP